ncbi:MAG TPA: Uma2 family endonuclease [Pirellulaceae bacterium]|nr:Uma2 family endonuclease [Pirellulaceae bacterium]
MDTIDTSITGPSTFSPPPVGAAQRVPPLESGDVMDRHEFERRWEAMPGLKRAELIDGVVFVPPALRYSAHGNPHLLLSTWLGSYLISTPGVEAGDAPTVRLDEKNLPQPDLCLFLPFAAGGKTKIASDDYLEGPPDLIVEVAASSVSLDLHGKKLAYEEAGVREYLIWRTLDGALDWFVASEGAFVPLLPDVAGLLKSRTFPGLWLDPQVLLAKDHRRLLEALERGLASPEHAQFVAQLQAALGQKPDQST